MSKSYSFPSSGEIRTKLRLDWRQLLTRGREWLKQSRSGVVQGALVGLFVAVCYSIIIVLQVVARRSIWFPSVDLTAWQIVGGYFAAFLSAGVVVGAFAPVLRWRIAAVLLGVLGGALVYGITPVIGYGFQPGWFHFAAQAGVALGGPIGYLLHYQLVPERRWSQFREVVSIIVMGVVLVMVELRIG